MNSFWRSFKTGYVEGCERAWLVVAGGSVGMGLAVIVDWMDWL